MEGLVSISGFYIWLFAQSLYHSFLWEKARVSGRPIPRKIKRIWAMGRGLFFALLIFPFWGFWGGLQFFFLLLVWFWVLYDILLPYLSGAPQLWQDKNLKDNNSIFDFFPRFQLLIKGALLIILTFL
jgi:hypothetical protein